MFPKIIGTDFEHTLKVLLDQKANQNLDDDQVMKGALRIGVTSSILKKLEQQFKTKSALDCKIYRTSSGDLDLKPYEKA